MSLSQSARGATNPSSMIYRQDILPTLGALRMRGTSADRTDHRGDEFDKNRVQTSFELVV